LLRRFSGAGTYNQEDYAFARPAFPRNRAHSADNPTQLQPAGQSAPIALVSAIPSGDQVDGLAPATTSHRTSMDGSNLADAIYSNAAHNASAPALQTYLSNTRTRTASPSSPGQGHGRRIAFAQNLLVHTTWPAAIYDRRAEPAACNRLTPQFAQRIKEELNAYKMEEMDVHPQSRVLTHFCT
jgi:hypothetical protein